MPNDYGSQDILCPYFKRLTEVWVSCEGFLPDSRVRLSFSRKADCTFWKDTYCKAGWQRCEIARMLNEKYEVDE